MESHSEVTKLCSLSEWSVQHIRDVFEAHSEEKCLRAISSTFSDAVNASINGMSLSREGINHLVLAMRRSSGDGLKVQWQQTMEVPRDAATNRDGSFGGVYVIRGIQKCLPGTQKQVAFERHKTVTVKIESQSSSSHYDSRRIVSLVFVASDVRVDRQTSL
ncbi:hypothetical protein L208DRAFT_1449658 [Tricholoma matsutake]|nr:hypothetical protein L208DRAFT_1449658 [Tricholoma matsutake 945]